MISENPFRLPLKTPWVAELIGRVLGLNRLANLYDRRPVNGSVQSFLNYTLESLAVKVRVTHGEDHVRQLADVGAAIVVANHPLGGVEGVALCSEILKVRRDVKVLTNELLTRIPEFKDLFIGVDVLSQNKQKKNLRGLRAAAAHLASGGVLIVFPAGMVSAINTERWTIEDRQWNRQVGLWMQKYQTSCLPVYVNGRNSWLFYLMGLIHPRLRTVMLPREMIRKLGRQLNLSYGPLVSSDEVRHLKTDRAVTDYLRLTTDLLRTPTSEQHSAAAKTVKRHVEALASPPSPSTLSNLMAKLIEFRCIQHRQFEAYAIPAAQMQELMPILGYFREFTFRTVGEGSGRSRDVDQYDAYYSQLVVFDREQGLLVGGYRYADTQQVIEAYGIKGLYSESIYHYQQAFIQDLGAALEVGRSWVHPEYQRRSTVLDLLWKGLGSVIAQDCRYQKLFGAVSISAEYSLLARGLLSDSLLANFSVPYQTDKVKPKAKLKLDRKTWTDDLLSSVNELSAFNHLVGRCDAGKSVPVLIRHYLQLNARFACFSVNQRFQDSLDGLVVVDIQNMPQKYLVRYLGGEAAERYTERREHETTKS